MKANFLSKVLLCLALISPVALQAKVVHLLPKPQSLAVTEGASPFTLSGAVTITYGDGLDRCELLEEFFTGHGCTIESGGKAVNVSLVASIAGAYDYELEGYENEAYTLEITATEINITAITNTGVIRAAQTLTQLAEGWDGTAALEALTMTDWPAFKLRGYMHDVGRSFLSKEELVKQIELFSRFKVNTFHWHLTENQAWRFEVKAHPELTEASTMTRYAGQFYTQDDCREVMAAAKKHGVIVIPEIDMPGHSEAFVRATGHSMQSDEGKVILKAVLDEVVEVFADAPYIHIGGDEVSTTADYLNEMIAYVVSKGKKAEIWNPINGIGQDALNASLAQMWGTRGYLASGKGNIDSRYNYTNHFDVFADLVGIYKSTIYYSQQGSAEVAGAVSGCWNDRKVETEADIMAQNNVWANVIATAERAWMGGGKQYIDNATNTPEAYKAGGYGGGVMLPNSGDEFEEFKSWETRFLFHKANSLKDEPIPYVKQTNVRWRITDAFPNGGSETAAFGPEEAGITADLELLPETYELDGKTYYTGMATGAGIYLAHTWGNSIINAYYDNPQFNHTAYAWTYVYSPTEQTVGAQIEFQNYSRSEQDAAAPAGKWDHWGSKIWINGEEIAAPEWENTGVSISSKEVDLKNENFPAREPIEVTLKQGWNKVFLKLPYFNSGYRLKKWMFTCVFTDVNGVNAVDDLIYSPNQCLDEATEQVAAKASEIKRNRSNYIGTAVGLWPESAAATLDAKIEAVEATYSDTEMTEAEREAQIAELETAWTDFVASLATADINRPVSSRLYRMYTPLRGNRYVTGNGADAAITGLTDATTRATVWQFLAREDGSYDIINLADGTYISPASSNNTALNTVEAQPDAGWSIAKAENAGNVIVVSGSVQFNQQKDGNFNLLNWGSGTNTTDDGCEYRFVDVTDDFPPHPIVQAENLHKQTYPYALDDALADKVFAREDITIAVDAVMPASMSGRQVLVGAADPTQAITGATKTNSPYIAYGLYGSNPAYLASSRDGDRFTYRDFAATANTNHKVVYVIDKTNKQFSIYVDGALKSTATYPVEGYELQSFSHLASNDNAKIYVGGSAVSTNSAYDLFGGKIKSVQFFEGALNAEQVAQIEYPLTEEEVFLNAAAEAHENLNIYGLQRYLGLVQNAGEGIEGDGQYVCNYPASTSQESGNAYANLLDGNYDTFFHSGYGATIGTGAHYLQADLGKAVSSFRFYFKKRKQNDNNRPTKITIEGSNDGESWGEVKVISSGFPTDAAVLDYYSEEISSNTAYRHYRFTVNTTNNSTVFYTFSEFYILPSATRVIETFDAVRAYRAEATVETATALQSVYAYNKGVNEGSPIVGVESYIYADTKQSDESYVARYLYNDNGTLATSTSQSSDKAFVWIASQPEGTNYYTFQNVGDNTKYLGYGNSGKGLTINTTPVQLDIQPSYAVHTGSVGMMRIGTDNDGKWMVTQANGSSFNRNSVKINNGSWCSDYVFIPVDLYKEAKLYVKAEVEGLEANNPNTHLGNICVNSSAKKFTLTTGVTQFTYNSNLSATVDFTRGYRGFELQGFYLGETNLGTNATLTDEQVNLITEENPLVAKFIPTEDATLFYDDDEFSYRIPAIGKTSTGRLIAVSDYRHNLDDIGRDNHGTGTLRIDLVVRTSDDNGKTWSAKQTIAEGSGNKNADGYDCAYGDAAIAAVGQKVLVMAAAGNVCYPYATDEKHNRTVRIFSEDNGATWTKEDISEKMFIGESALIPNGHAAFFGSGKLAVDEDFNGTGQARIYGAMLVKNASATTNIYVIYTDDFGANWNILGGSTTPVANADEPKVEILPNGQILLSARRVGGRLFNVFTYGSEANDKADGVGTWNGTQNGCSNGGSNGTNGEIYCVDAVNANGEAVKLLLQSQPKGGSSQYDRKNVTIWYKEVSAVESYTTAQIADGWTEGLQVSEQQSSYSAMILQDDGRIAFFFEEAPCYDDNYTKGYSMVYVPLTIEGITKGNYTTPEAEEEEGSEVVSLDALPGDGTLRFYRLAIPVTLSAYTEDFDSSYDNVKSFWQDCEDFVNKMFVPLGFCFDVVVDERLVMKSSNLIDENVYNATSYGTELLGEAVGADAYDVGLWVTYREVGEENTGLSIDNGAYASSTKGSGYAKTDKWVVAHELGHMFGAPHTTTGEGSLMDTGGEYFSYPSIKIIRNSVKGTTSHLNVEVANNAPQFDAEQMKTTYRIPQGACFAIDVKATDVENHKLMYTAIGCDSSNVADVIESVGYMPHFASFAPQESSMISYAPVYTADLNYEDLFYLKEGTAIHEMEAGTYALSFLVNDVPSTDFSHAALMDTPFYSTYAIWESNVEIVEGTSFNASLTPAKQSYAAGEELTVSWGVNENYFTEESRLRISLSSDYGKTFNYVLAEDVRALDGECTVTLPNVNVGKVDVDFTTAVRQMNGGIIKIEEVGGNAYTLTLLNPNNDNSFTITGGVDAVEATIGSYKIATFFANDAMIVPFGVKAYVATQQPTMNGTDANGNSVGVITLTEVENGIVPAATGVVITGEAGTYEFIPSGAAGVAVEDNMLRGYAGSSEYEEVALPTDGSVNYVLTVKNDVAGFYKKVAGFKVYNHKAYLNVPSSGSQALRIRFENADGTTDIHDVMFEAVEAEKIFDLTGRRVRQAGKGVYIVNGKKVLR